MTKLEFLIKYPELCEDGNVSIVKISLLKNYTTHSISNGDDKIKNLLKDYEDMSRCEDRDSKINYLLKERLARRLRSNQITIQPLVL
jgi:hypothetical protein